VAFHETFAGPENAETLVFVHATRWNCRLFPDHSLALYLSVFAGGIVNEPPARDELSRLKPDILDSDVIGKHIVPGSGLGLIAKIRGTNRYADPVGFFVIEGLSHR
jgi:hypothetical protein